MYFYIVPVNKQKNYRGPEYLKWRFGFGIDCKWSMKDFGNDVPIAIVVTNKKLSIKDERLEDYGIDTHWINKSSNPREKIHRTLGMALAMQSGIDKPDLWLGREICFGFNRLLPYDYNLFRREQINNFKKWLDSRYSNVNGRLVPVLQGAALPASDTFTETTNTALTSHTPTSGFTWAYNSGSFLVVAASNTVRGNTAGTECGAHDNTDTFGNDHYSQVSMFAVNGNPSGPATRCHASAGTYYGYYLDNGTGSYLFKMVTTTWTQLGSNGATGADGSTYYLSSVGTTQTPKKDGVTADIGAQTDNAIASGAGGISSYSNSSVSLIDNFLSDNISSGVVIPVFMNQYRQRRN